MSGIIKTEFVEAANNCGLLHPPSSGISFFQDDNSTDSEFVKSKLETVLKEANNESLLKGNGIGPKKLIEGAEQNKVIPPILLERVLHRKRYLQGDYVEYPFENFREMIAWGVFVRYCVENKPQYFKGTLMVNSGNVLSQLRPIMQGLGFRQPITTAAFSGLFETNEYAMALSTSPAGDPDVHTFRLGGCKTADLRRLLGEIGRKQSIEVEVDEWEPRTW